MPDPEPRPTLYGRDVVPYCPKAGMFVVKTACEECKDREGHLR